MLGFHRTCVYLLTVYMAMLCKCEYFILYACLHFSLCSQIVILMDIQLCVLAWRVHGTYSTHVSDDTTLSFEVIFFLVFSWSFAVSILQQVQIISSGLKEAFLVYNEPESTSMGNSFACLKYRKYKDHNVKLLNCILLLLVWIINFVIWISPFKWCLFVLRTITVSLCFPWLTTYVLTLGVGGCISSPPLYEMAVIYVVHLTNTFWMPGYVTHLLAPEDNMEWWITVWKN